MSSPQAGRPRRGALHGGLALRPVVPGPARPRLPQVEPGRAGRLPEPARHPRPRRAEPRLHGLRRPHRRRPEIAAEALRLLRVPVGRRLRGRRSPRCPRWTPRRRPGSASASSSCATSTAGSRRSGSTSPTSTACSTTSTPPRRRPAPHAGDPAATRPPTWRTEMGRARARVVCPGARHAGDGCRGHRLAGAGAPSARRRAPAAQAPGDAVLDRAVAGRLHAAASTSCPTSATDRGSVPQGADARARPTRAWPAGSPTRPETLEAVRAPRASTATTATPATATPPTT